MRFRSTPQARGHSALKESGGTRGGSTVQKRRRAQWTVKQQPVGKRSANHKPAEATEASEGLTSSLSSSFVLWAVGCPSLSLCPLKEVSGPGAGSSRNGAAAPSAGRGAYPRALFRCRHSVRAGVAGVSIGRTPRTPAARLLMSSRGDS